MPTRHGYMIKQPGEVLDRAVDFSERLAGSATITVGSVTAVEAGACIDADGKAISLEPDEIEEGDDVTSTLIGDDPEPLVQTGKLIQFRLQGGDSGKRYLVNIVANGDDGQVAEYDLYVDVKGISVESVGS